MFNGDWISSFPKSNVEHLSRTISDHSPLLIKVSQENFLGFKLFWFQNMWLYATNFNNLVKENWEAPTHFYHNDNATVLLAFKLKRLK